MTREINYIYILKCEGDRLYTGYTSDLQRRWEEHLSRSEKSKFTRAFGVVKMIAAWEILGDRSEAQKIEAWVKKKSRKSKDELIENQESLTEVFEIASITETIN